MMSYLKRRFSQGDLLGEGQDETASAPAPPAAATTSAAAATTSSSKIQQAPALQSTTARSTSVSGTSPNNPSFQPLVGSQSTHSSTTNLSAHQPNKSIGSAQLPRKSYGPSPSAPSSPTKTLSFSAMMSAARDILSNTPIGQQQPQSGPGAGRMLSRQMTLIMERTKVLFVFDDAQVDWSRYFRNRTLFNDYEIRVEQVRALFSLEPETALRDFNQRCLKAEFKEINLASYSNNGTIVDLNVERNGIRLVRSFKPDYLLIRQPAKDIDNDWRNLLIGFKYGSIASTNSLDSIYNFRDKPWVVSQLGRAHSNHQHFSENVSS